MLFTIVPITWECCWRGVPFGPILYICGRIVGVQYMLMWFFRSFYVLYDDDDYDDDDYDDDDDINNVGV